MSISYLLLLLLLLLLSRFSRVHQAPPSLGFSRQEHWSGMPFPSPMHESESEVAQSCLTLHNPMDCSPPGSSIQWIFQARILEWGAIAFSEFFASYVKFYILVVISCLVTMFESFVTPWTVAHQPPLSMGFPRQEYRSGLPFPTLGELPNSGIESVLPALAGRLFITISTWTFKYWFSLKLINTNLRGWILSDILQQRAPKSPEVFLSQVKAQVTQSRLTLCAPMDCIVPGILWARILEWVAFPFSKGSSQPRDRIQVSCIAGRFFTSWATRETQEYWSG